MEKVGKNLEHGGVEPVNESRERRKEIVIGKKTLVLLAGLPGSGKSTFAVRHFPLDAIVSTDRLREELSNNPGNQLVSEKAFILARKIVEERLKNGELAVVDAQNLTENTRDQFYQAAEKTGARVEVIFLNVTPEQSVERDIERAKKTGAEYIKSRRGLYKTAKHAMEKSKRVHAMHVIEPDEADAVDIKLPEDYMESMDADKELRLASESAQTLISALETGFVKPEIPEGAERIPVPAGAVVFIEGPSDDFKKTNFFSHQIIDAEDIAKRLKTEITDEAVADVMKYILKQRTRLNLTTAVAYPAGVDIKEKLLPQISEEETKRKIKIPTIDLDAKSAKNAHVEIQRDAPVDAPLFLVGDVHGCYEAMRELTSQIREENLALERGENPPLKRQIVFVGDMADRGPYDAETAIYITGLVRSGRAMLVKGNHDENLLAGLKGEFVGSKETKDTVQELKKRLKPESIQKMIEMLERAPLYAEWQHLVVAHASLPRVPKPGEEISESEKKIITHGAKSGKFIGGRSEIWKMHNVAAKDPDVLVVGGHTHEEEAVINKKYGTSVIDVSAEITGKLYGLYYPELEFASAEEPSVIKMYKHLENGRLPEGQELLKFIEYANAQGFIETKYGEGEYEGLILTTYSGVTEAGNLWEKYPTLRHFRGLILDTDGNIVARPFEKTHKAGDEIPLEKLNVVPDKVFEKANGSMGIVYYWKNKWRAATKFSFENDNYTKPTIEMLSQMNMETLNPSKTYLFEIILPNDSHIVDYGGKRELVLLNSIDPKTGAADDWNEVLETSRKLGARTAEDLTEKFTGKTIAEIYEFAHGEGNLTGYEGLMAVYKDENGKSVTVKVKSREYDGKKFVRDRMDWEDILEAFNPADMEISEENKEKLLLYNFDNNYARAALEARIAWVKKEYSAIAQKAKEFLFSPLTDAEKKYNENLQKGVPKNKAVSAALAIAAPKIIDLLKQSGSEATKSEVNALMAFLRSLVSGDEKPEEKIARYALQKIKKRIGTEKKKRGQNAFWLTPEDKG